MNKPTLYLMLGYPGAGKTTVAEMVSELTGAVRLTSDQIRLHMFKRPTFTRVEHDVVYNTLDYLTELLLEKGVSVIYDANLNKHQYRQEKYDICERTGARTHLLWVQTPIELAHERATLRGHHHLIPADETFETLFNRVANTVEPPHKDEPFTPIDGTNVSKTGIRKSLGLQIASN